MSFFPWPSSSPPYRIFEDTSRYKEFDKHPMTFAIRMVRVILQTFRENHGDGVRWYIMADDDTILFVKNLVEILARYDHRKYFYIGENSECILSNMDNSFNMAFGGAGYALSYPLVEALAKNMEVCIKRYPTLFGSDHMLQACIADLGVALTHEKGFHQIDLHGDISGFLSAHPQSPFISLHHLDTVDPLFPFMNRSQSLSHLMKAADADQSRLLQQTICYQHQQNWSFSIAWGYSVQIYEQLIPPSFLLRPLETFAPWRKLPPRQPPYRFNTRLPSRNPCEDPHVFFFESVEEIRKDRIFTTYRRRSGRRERDCNYSTAAADVFRVSVISPATRYGGVGTRRECCDIVNSAVKDNVKIKIRSCMKYEIIA
ncbi:hypothetical protein Nepgr_009234 [Nepenthes gracilis]|uniref:Uncharacterized protein n=1 Tax=Nepenthes gracilis TaxID=150966 RepID=A0AAD3XK17_NEPGR|nr:hypothetical protein Nepgr_009234 [Nepenthes gracilis]